MDLEREAVDEVVGCVAKLVGLEGEGLVAFLIEEVGAVSIGVEVSGGAEDEIRLFELILRFESLIEDGLGKQVAHLQSH